MCGVLHENSCEHLEKAIFVPSISSINFLTSTLYQRRHWYNRNSINGKTNYQSLQRICHKKNILRNIGPSIRP